MKLRAFIGSSGESLNVANAIKSNLSELDVTVWKVDFFRMGKTALQTLLSKLGDFDLAVFVFADDDDLRVRDKEHLAPRDNVIFEYGLFTSELGATRSFVVRAKNKALRWMSDLEGLDVAEYDEELASRNADEAVKGACERIRLELREMVPRPGVYINTQWRRLNRDWWSYGTSTQLTTLVDEEGIEFSTNDGKQSTLRFPGSENLNASGRFCALRIQATRADADRRFYVALRIGSKKKFLFMSDYHAKEGWASRDEFKLSVPRLETGTFHKFIVDLNSLEPYIGSSTSVEGVQIGPGLKLSHFCICDTIPGWLRSVPPLLPSNAPLITIEQPVSGQSVSLKCWVRGTLLHPQKNQTTHYDMQVFVFAPNGLWYPQGNLKLAEGKWEIEATIGDENSVGHGFTIAATTVDDKPIFEPVTELPVAMAKKKVTVIRRT